MKSDNICGTVCTGCGACSAICPKDAIQMEYNERGFIEPVINDSLCVGCRACTITCNKEIGKNSPIESMILRHKNYEKYCMSQSGGAFTLFSDYILASDGVIYGAAVDAKNELTHIRINDASGRGRMHGSFYIQSRAFSVFDMVEQDLKEQKHQVLFVGTPCQVEAIKKYFISRRLCCDNLTTIDILCHGVPSILIWREIIEIYEKSENAKLETVVLSGQEENRRPFISFVINGKSYSDSTFRKIYYSNLALRKSCYSCRFTSTDRVGDISIGDAAGIQQKNPEFYNPKGTSLVFINTKNGIDLFENVKEESFFKNVNITDYMQECLVHPPRCKREPAEFWNDFDNKSFNYVIKKYANHDIFLNINYIFKRFFYLLRSKLH